MQSLIEERLLGVSESSRLNNLGLVLSWACVKSGNPDKPSPIMTRVKSSFRGAYMPRYLIGLDVQALATEEFS